MARELKLDHVESQTSAKRRWYSGYGLMRGFGDLGWASNYTIAAFASADPPMGMSEPMIVRINDWCGLRISNVSRSNSEQTFHSAYNTSNGAQTSRFHLFIYYSIS